MTYIVLARKWRPMVFEDVVGQEHVTRTLMNALKNQRTAHAYIFAGPRGVGKTTTARLLAKALNCEKQPAVNPCNECENCKSITNSRSMDVIEIDGASNRGIDEIRNLRDNIRYAPASLQYKIYIIDEVHMLTKEAFNALLKTLEEPPSHAIFIFATTEIHKVPLTILSRCQRFDFKRIAAANIEDQLKKIVQAEKIDIDEEALFLITRKADGSMRDAESILDQMISFSDGKLTVEQVRLSLGMIDQEIYFEFTDLLQQKDTAKILDYAGKVMSSGHDLIDYLHGLQEHFRNLLIGNVSADEKLIDIPDVYRERYQEAARKFQEKDLIHYLQITNDSESELKFSVFPQLSLEMLFLKIANKPAHTDLEEILSFLESIKKNPEIKTQGNKGEEIQSNSTSQQTTSPNYKYPVQSEGERSQNQNPKKVKEEKNDVSGKNFKNLEQKLNKFQNLEQDKLPETDVGKVNTEISLEEVNQKWSQIVEKVRSNKVALGSFLQEGMPLSLENGNLSVAYDKSAEFHKEHVEKNKKVIENILSDQFQLSLRVNFKTIDFNEMGIEKQPRTPEEILQDIKNKEPIIRKIIDTFELDDIEKLGQ